MRDIRLFSKVSRVNRFLAWKVADCRFVLRRPLAVTRPDAENTRREKFIVYRRIQQRFNPPAMSYSAAKDSDLPTFFSALERTHAFLMPPTPPHPTPHHTPSWGLQTPLLPFISGRLSAPTVLSRTGTPFGRPNRLPKWFCLCPFVSLLFNQHPLIAI